VTLPPQAPGTATPQPAPNGRVGADPAHNGGPLPQATLLELAVRLVNDTSDLADRQIELAKQEINEAKDDAIGSAKKLAIGGGIAVAAAVLLIIWAWTAFIWFFNWLGSKIEFSLFGGTQSLAWIGWLLGIVVPAAAAYFAYRRFISAGISQAKGIFPPLPRTRETLKEDLEWVQTLRTRNAR
jgi:hypothetical protein